MGENEGLVEPIGTLPNGLLPGAGPVLQPVDAERWLRAEERTAQLISCIQPNQLSEEQRNAVADYVQRLITKCFPCQVLVRIIRGCCYLVVSEFVVTTCFNEVVYVYFA